MGIGREKQEPRTRAWKTKPVTTAESVGRKEFEDYPLVDPSRFVCTKYGVGRKPTPPATFVIW